MLSDCTQDHNIHHQDYEGHLLSVNCTMNTLSSRWGQLHAL